MTDLEKKVETRDFDPQTIFAEIKEAQGLSDTERERLTADAQALSMAFVPTTDTQLANLAQRIQKTDASIRAVLDKLGIIIPQGGRKQ